MTYLSAQKAAEILGVSLGTLYSYVSRRGIRSVPVEGTRQRLYWEDDVRNARRRKGRPSRTAEAGIVQSSLSLVDAGMLYYRGRPATALAETATLEEVAELLWGAGPGLFASTRPIALPTTATQVLAAMAGCSGLERASATLALIEASNPRTFDHTAAGLAKCGAEAVRSFAAILLRRSHLPVRPLHELFAEALGLDAGWTQIVRQMLVLSADNGMEASTQAVRALAGLGISPFRYLACGLTLQGGRLAAMNRNQEVDRFLAEIAGRDVRGVILQWLRDEGRVPGFGSDFYPAGDPRASSMLATLETCVPAAPGLRPLREAVAFVADELGERPNFALLVRAVDRHVLPDKRDSLFPLGRSVGWIAHSIERSRAGQLGRLPAHYTGPLPHETALAERQGERGPTAP